jgi:CheY-like chemotaxis protein
LAQSISGPGSDGKKLKVLVVDDEMFVRLMAVDAIEDAGHSTIEAANADEAVDVLEGHTDIDVIFTDIRMPGSMDGLGLAALARQRWPDVHIIVTSGHITLPEMDPATPFLAKPYRTRTLTDRLAAIAG